MIPLGNSCRGFGFCLLVLAPSSTLRGIDSSIKGFGLQIRCCYMVKAGEIDQQAFGSKLVCVVC